MEVKIIWTESAIEDLHNIHYYYKITANIKLANRIANKIIDKTLILEKASRIGQEEELLKHLKKEIRYLIEGHYKIVYIIEDNIIAISTIFDCRQNPQKLRKRKF